jgi:hypothetical protein
MLGIYSEHLLPGDSLRSILFNASLMIFTSSATAHVCMALKVLLVFPSEAIFPAEIEHVAQTSRPHLISHILLVVI